MADDSDQQSSPGKEKKTSSNVEMSSSTATSSDIRYE
jgi:hypothetical protein